MKFILPKLASIVQSSQLWYKTYWNLNKTRIQATRQSRPRALAQKFSNQIYSTIPMSQKWYNYKCAINATSGVLLRFKWQCVF
jgi:hypothetical protein